MGQRLIDADTLKKDFNINFGGVSHAAAAAEIIDRQPTIDPESLFFTFKASGKVPDHFPQNGTILLVPKDSRYEVYLLKEDTP